MTRLERAAKALWIERQEANSVVPIGRRAGVRDRWEDIPEGHPDRERFIGEAEAVLDAIDEGEFDDDEDGVRSRSYGVGDAAHAFFAGHARHGSTWGRWRFDAATLTLDLDSQIAGAPDDPEERSQKYWVALESILGPHELLQWIGQISDKKWAPSALGDFVQALDSLLGLRDWGQPRSYRNDEEVVAKLRERFPDPRQDRDK